MVQNNYNASYWWWSRNDLITEGQWKLQFTYNNKTVEHFFNIGNLSTNDFQLKKFKIHPNPTNDFVKFETENEIQKVKILDLTGKLVEEIDSKEMIKEVKLQSLSKGTYVLIAIDNQGNQFTEKVIRK